MKLRLLIAIATAGFASSGGWAQSTGGSNAAEQSVTQSLNAGVDAHAQATDAANQAAQDQYELDRAAFRAEAASRHAKIVDDQAAYERQQRAYADAMAAWRKQTDDCKAGDKVSCRKPTPVPADYYKP